MLCIGSKDHVRSVNYGHMPDLSEAKRHKFRTLDPGVVPTQTPCHAMPRRQVSALAINTTTGYLWTFQPAYATSCPQAAQTVLYQHPLSIHVMSDAHLCACLDASFHVSTLLRGLPHLAY